MISFERVQKFAAISSLKMLLLIVVGIGLGLLTAVLSRNPLALFLVPPAVFLASTLARRHAGHFVRGVYGLKKDAQDEAEAILYYRWLGARPMFNPYVLVKDGAVAGGSEVLQQMGGPGGLVLYRESAVVLEKHGVISRVIVGPSFPDLEPFERVWDVIDLRPQRWVFDVSAITADGIPINYDADVHFQVEPKEEAVLKAALSTWVREAYRTEPDRLMTWTKRVVIGETEGVLRSILAHYVLDDLLKLEVREAIRKELYGKLVSFSEKLGVQILDVNLKDLKLRGKVIEQWFETWRTERLRVMELEIAEGKAERLRRLEQARAEVRRKLLEETVEMLQAAPINSQSAFNRLVILSCIEVMKRTAFDLNIFLPADLIKTLDDVRASLRNKGTSSQAENDNPPAPAG